MLKKFLILCLVASMLMAITSCGATNFGSTASSEATKNDESLQKFYDKLSKSQELLDTVADDIYSYWYDCIYKDKYLDDINYAIASALSDNKENIDEIKALDTEISELFKEVKDGEHSSLVKETMSAYSDYYEFVINVSGSFESYKTNKETLKKELASLLRDLSYEL